MGLERSPSAAMVMVTLWCVVEVPEDGEVAEVCVQVVAQGREEVVSEEVVVVGCAELVHHVVSMFRKVYPIIFHRMGIEIRIIPKV